MFQIMEFLMYDSTERKCDARGSYKLEVFELEAPARSSYSWIYTYPHPFPAPYFEGAMIDAFRRRVCHPGSPFNPNYLN